MQIFPVLLAAAAAMALGAVWHAVLGRHWRAASGLSVERVTGPGRNVTATRILVSAACLILVAAMMRHIFDAAGIQTARLALFAGFGLGLGIAAPWIAMGNVFGPRPVMLTLITGGLASVACAVMGLVLVLV